ncbi:MULTISPECIES: hypothetical protein [Mycobacterium]|uniref:Vitamin K epoxide reductase domain-containing protein n=1 Tax=Mycobacterium persicum TaxID=1487726 RepID=A0AB38UTP2_9MYCO|nr:MULTISPECIES: hypothetical protein [Mycobacterium]KZS85134.1 hypothetical protein A4G31_25825 [Mycobacterium persicum]ORB58512.1 hypothetical protein BST40_02145 [Mycobacterium persicum]ORB92264.1 hypothetical protein B1T49_26795 [Mycobacterium persicum]ORB97650.1 hypothetical protein B1T44_27570 [Mycobacterium persicum]ORC04324.1 hypothetical protein B1T48_26855 [Mycobacterium persicum]
MAAPHRPEDRPGSGTADPQVPRVLKLRIVPWDVISTVVASGLLLYLVTATSWPSRLFAFTDNVCLSEDCPPVPYGANYYIYPLMWGGIGAAIAAAVIGPFVSMVKGWYMSFWPIIAVGVMTVTSVLGYALAGFSERYWH